jgi:hypothetical protein
VEREQFVLTLDFTGYFDCHHAGFGSRVVQRWWFVDAMDVDHLLEVMNNDVKQQASNQIV